MTYAETLDYLFAQLPMFHRIGPAAFKKDLTNTHSFCEHLGHPELQFPAIHIAGTNGKGSTAHFLAAIFTARGYKTGLYTSPHYRDFRERIKVDGAYISRKAVIAFVEKHREFSQSIHPSFFEWTVALAFDYFATEKVDIAIIETGLGGRLDSTNVITPLVSVITNIGYDHQQFLGDTLPQIASEKAGIIKSGVPVVIGETQPETRSVFEAKAAELHAPIYFADQHFQAKLLRKSDTHAYYQVSESVIKENNPLSPALPAISFPNPIALNHLADYQQKNLCTVLMTMQVFDNLELIKKHSTKQCRSAVEIEEAGPGGKARENSTEKKTGTRKEDSSNMQGTLRGLEELCRLTQFIGRWTMINLHPRILCDSAHNEAGIRTAMQSLSKMTFEHLHIVFGMVSDKSPDKVLSLLPPDATYYFAKANIPRGLDAKELRQVAARFGLQGKAYVSVRSALAAARKRAKEQDLIYVGGSIFVVAEVI